jgi:hypothetical protein
MGTCAGIALFFATGAVAPFLFGYDLCTSYTPPVLVGALLAITLSCILWGALARLLTQARFPAHRRVVQQSMRSSAN